MPRWPARRRLLQVVLVLVAMATAGPVVVARAAEPSEFPRGNTGYHTYAEMKAAVSAAAAAYPGIVSVRSIGKSYQGRDIVAAKISDNVAID
jgi:carboxypeptidase T